MDKSRWFLVYAIFLIAGLMIQPRPARATTFSDSEFNAADWEVVTKTLGSGGSTSASQKSAGGNPGAYREVIIEVKVDGEEASKVFGFHRKIGATYNPAVQGPIHLIEYSEDAVSLECSSSNASVTFSCGQGTGLALQQNGKIYISDAAFTNFFGEGCDTEESGTPRESLTRCMRIWKHIGGRDAFGNPRPLRVTNPLDMQLLDFSGPFLLTDPTQHPDFSASGSEIQFGFFRMNGFPTSQRPRTFTARTTAGIDNWSVAINPVPAIPIQSVFNNQQPEMAEPGVFALVAKKDMVVRVFFDTGVNPPGIANAELCVDAEVAGCPQDHHFTALPGTAFPAGHAFTVEQRRAAENSLNIFIRGEAANRLLTTGEHVFAVEASDGQSKKTNRFTGNFRESQRLNLFVIPITLNDAAGHPIPPDPRVLMEAGDLIKRIYPVDEENVTVTVLKAEDASGEVEEDRTKVTATFMGKVRERFLTVTLFKDPRVLPLFTQVPARNNFLVGVVHNVIGQNNAPLGFTSSGAPRGGSTFPHLKKPGMVVTLDHALTTADRPNKILIKQVVAHEIGHVFGCGDDYALGPSKLRCSEAGGQDIDPHPATADASGNAAGYYILEDDLAFDVDALRPRLQAEDPGAAPPANPAANPIFITVDNNAPDKDPIAEGPVYGFMGGSGRVAVPTGLGADLEGMQDVRAWTPRAHYQILYPLLTGPPAKDPPARDVILVSGMLTLAGQVRFNSFLVATTTLDLPRPADGHYAIEFVDATGRVLDHVGFDVSFTRHLIGDGDEPIDEVPFSLVLDLPAGTSFISLLKDGTPLKTFAKSANPPTVKILTARLSGDRLTVGWSGSDPDGDALHYVVMYSPNGRDRFVIAPDITTTSLTASLDGLPAPDANAQVIVHARDGFNASEATVGLLPRIPGDLNGDGVVNCADLGIVKASFGKRAGQPGFDPRADVNSDGVVNILDLAFVARQLPAGTHCP